MLVDTSEANLISTQGWNDKGAIWWCRTESSSWQKVPLSDASYLTLHQGADDLFAVVHHFSPVRENQVIVTAHHIAAPAQVLARITLPEQGREALWEGETSIWGYLPRAYIANYYHHGNSYHMLLINSGEQRAEVQQLSWYDSDSYDLGYQGLLEATEIPGSELLLVSIQRDSEPVIYDPKAQKAVGKIALGNRGGNPHLQFRRTAFELWADDYDTLLRLDPRDWKVTNSRRLQGPPVAGSDGQPSEMAQFIGGYAFNKDESLCAVARPFSGDVLAIDTKSFDVMYQAVTEGQPLDVALLSDRRVFCRDWKSGDLLLGGLENLPR